jgi:hypothetical protein
MYTMNRCLLRLALTGCLSFACCGFANAQVDPQRIPPMKSNAVPAVMEVKVPPEITLDGKAERLSPGARIRARNNLLILSGALVGQLLPVRYLRDSSGLVHEVWILTEAEITAVKKAPPVQQARP